MEFRKLENGNIHEVESKYVKEWKDKDILKETIENRKDCPDFVFYDGPIYANAKLEFIMCLLRLLKMLFVSIRLCLVIEF